MARLTGLVHGRTTTLDESVPELQGNFPDVPEDTAASQLVDPHVGREGFLDVFGHPAHDSACWDPKPDAPSNIRGEFKPIKTRIPGTWIGEHMPMMAEHLDKATLIRSMSYTPNGLFNHTAAIYQMLTGYPPDRSRRRANSSRPLPPTFPPPGVRCRS